MSPGYAYGQGYSNQFVQDVNVQAIGGVSVTTPIAVAPVASTVTAHQGGAWSVGADLQKIGGTAVDTGSGAASPGTQRVILATDQPSIPVTGSVSAAVSGTVRVDTGSITAFQGSSPWSVDATSDIVTSGVLNNAGDTVTVAMQGRHSGAFNLTGTWSGSIVLEGSTDNGATWSKTWFSSINNSITAFGLPVPTQSATSNGSYKIFNTGGITRYRVRAETLAIGPVAVSIAVVDSQPAFKYGVNGIQQMVAVSTINSTLDNLAPGAMFTGQAENTLGVNAIQVTAYSDQILSVYVEQAQDGRWILTDLFIVHPSTGEGRTFQAVGAKFRIRVVNNGSATTTVMQIQSILCPIVEALPRALTPDGNLRVAQREAMLDSDTGGWARISPTNSLMVEEKTRLIGSVFGSTAALDTTFWVATNTVNATTSTANGYLSLTAVNANSTSTVNTFRVARYYIGDASNVRLAVQLPDTGVSNNRRRWGAFDALGSNGIYFELDGTVLSVGTIRNGVSTGYSAFNGELGQWAIDTSVHVYEIITTGINFSFFVDSVLLHTIKSTNNLLVLNPNLPIGLQSWNKAGASGSVSMNVWGASLSKMGGVPPRPIYFHQNAASGVTTHSYKLGPGTFRRLLIWDKGAGVCTFYDGTSTAGTVIANPNTANVYGPQEIDLDFYSGLFSSCANGAAEMTVVFD